MDTTETVPETDQLDQTMTGSEPEPVPATGDQAAPVEQLDKKVKPQVEEQVKKDTIEPEYDDKTDSIIEGFKSLNPFKGGKGFNYSNTETKQQGGTRVVRKVNIKNGKGYKSVTKYRKGKKTSTVKKPIHFAHIESIRMGIFIPRLFADCRGSDCGKTKTHRKK